MSYLNSPRKGCLRGMKICVWTHLGIIKWKTTSKKIRNGRRPQKKRKTTSKKAKKEDDLQKSKKGNLTFEDDDFKEDNKALNDQGEGERELMLFCLP